ncbi:hypothetical protein NMG29_29010 [Streptomyces cocklensis]|uniref:hypothetical protein n=1 Tax=Actinacidiphila cocklensis TaxID=887465 RepID=UPI00203E23A0|nr:hypothetical protein [Actinacidiphila cocklensis]MDD1062213.1 hypothetical protein [Actinacidiphila cocklensis]
MAARRDVQPQPVARSAEWVTADGSYRVAERGVSNRESEAAVAVTEAVIAGLFGIEAGLGGLAGRVEGTTRGEFGELTGVRAVGFDLPGGRPAG